MKEIRKMKFNRTGKFTICIILLLILGICQVSAGSPILSEPSPGWKYHGELNNTGVYDDGGFRPNGQELWNVSGDTGSDISMVVSSPAVIDGVVYVTDRGDPGHLFAINAKTGVIKWENTLPDKSFTSPAVANGMVYVGTGWPATAVTGHFYAFNASTGGSSGTPVWSKTLPYGPVGSSPSVAYGNVYVGRGDHNVSAWNATTGAVVWTFATPGPVYSSPAVANGWVYFSSPDTSGGDNIFAVNAITGAKEWDAKNVSGYDGSFGDVGSYLGSSPAVANGVLYIGSSAGVFAFNAYTGAKLRKFTDPDGGYIVSTPAVANGLVYFGNYGTNPHHFYALNANDFSVNWSNQTPDDTEMSSSPAVANGVVYVTSENSGNLPDKGFLYAWNATSGKFLWKFPLMEGGTQSSPAVANGVVYIGTRLRGLIAVGTEHTTSAAKIGVFRNGHGWYLDSSGDGAWGGGDTTYGFGMAGDVPVTGNWSGDGKTEIGVFRNGHGWYLDSSGNGAWGGGDTTYGFGMAGDVPVTGDWNTDGKTEIGVFRNGHGWYLDSSGNGAWGGGDTTYGFGMSGDVPVTGDWNTDGKTEIGVFRNGHGWYLDSSGDGAWGAGDTAYGFGMSGDVPVTGDWNADGKTEIGVFRNGHGWYLDSSGDGAWGAGDTAYGFGISGDKPVTGKWS